MSDTISEGKALEFVSNNLCARQYKGRHGSRKDFTAWEEINTPETTIEAIGQRV
jgi:hypothetical protein